MSFRESATNVLGATAISASSGTALGGFSGFLTNNQVIIGLGISAATLIVYFVFSLLNHLELKKR